MKLHQELGLNKDGNADNTYQSLPQTGLLLPSLFFFVVA